jgi:hypothetical protein
MVTAHTMAKAEGHYLLECIPVVVMSFIESQLKRSAQDDSLDDLVESEQLDTYVRLFFCLFHIPTNFKYSG